MIPGGFVFLDSFPITPSGKIDREKLRLYSPPDRTRSAADPPKTKTELLLSAIWSELLGRVFVGRQDDFFDQGGDSLTAAVVAARVQAAFQVDLDLRAFVEHGKLTALADLIDKLHREGGAPRSPGLVRVSRRRRYLCLTLRTAFGGYSQTPEGSAGYTVACSHRLLGALDIEATSRERRRRRSTP